MKLLTKALRQQLPALYSTDEMGMEAVAIVKFFHPLSNWTAYATEFDGEDTFFGLVHGQDKELGYFLLSEMENTVVRGLKVERDLYFKPTKLFDITGA